MAFDYDIFIGKTLKRTTEIAYWTSGGGTGDADWEAWTDPSTGVATNTIQVELDSVRVERFIKKSVIVIMRGRSYTQYGSYDAVTQLWDFKRIEEHFKIGGELTKSTWTKLNTEMRKMYDIVTDGGAFYFYWHSTDTPTNYFTVDALTTQLIQDTSALNKIEFHFDFVRGESRST